jgi:streptogramin lyase
MLADVRAVAALAWSLVLSLCVTAAASPSVKIHRVPLPFAHEGIATIGPEGSTWQLGGSPFGTSISRLSESGQTLSSYTLPPDTLTSAVSSGPGDAVSFFTEAVSGHYARGLSGLGRLTQSGELTVAPLAVATASPLFQSVNAGTIGPEGDLWSLFFVGGNHGATLGRTNTATGIISNFPIPVSPGNARSVVTGTDGTIWAVAATAVRARAHMELLRVERQNADVQMIPIPGKVQQSISLTPAPNGALWITAGNGQYLGNYVGRISYRGTFKQLPLPHPGGNCQSPAGIVSLRDGSLLLHTEPKSVACRAFVSSHFARLTATGKMTKVRASGPVLTGVERADSPHLSQTAQLLLAHGPGQSGEPLLFRVDLDEGR